MGAENSAVQGSGSEGEALVTRRPAGTTPLSISFDGTVQLTVAYEAFARELDCRRATPVSECSVRAKRSGSASRSAPHVQSTGVSTARVSERDPMCRGALGLQRSAVVQLAVR